MQIQLIDETGLPASDISNLTVILSQFANQVAQGWNLGNVAVTINSGDAKVYITERNRKMSALGYHTIENGVVTAYISRKAVPSTYGRYVKGLVLRGKQITQPRYTPGLVSVLAHEIAEMLCDPAIANYSAVDSQGRPWLIEVCDHVAGCYTTTTVNNALAVLPDVTLPNFYKLNSSAPYSIYGGASAPFTLTKYGYGYYKSPSGSLVQL